MPGEIDRLEANVLGVRESFLVHVSDQHCCRAKDARGRCGREADRPCAGDVDRRSNADLGGDGSVKSRRQNIGKAGQVTDLFHRMRLVRKFQQVEICIGHHHVLGLPADPSAHIDISKGTSGPVGVDVEADAGVAFPTGPATAACDVERNRYEVADLKILDVTAFLDHFAGDLVSEHHAGRRRRAAADHVLVGTADLRRYDLENDAVIDRLSCWIAEGRKVDFLNFDAAGFEVNHATIGSHWNSFAAALFSGSGKLGVRPIAPTAPVGPILWCNPRASASAILFRLANSCANSGHASGPQQDRTIGQSAALRPVALCISGTKIVSCSGSPKSWRYATEVRRLCPGWLDKKAE